MSDAQNAVEVARDSKAPKVFGPSSRVNVAMPFGSISISEPSKEMSELVQIVTEMLQLLAADSPSETVALLRDRADVLAQRLR